MPDRIRVVLADDNDDVRRIIEVLLGIEDALEVVGLASQATQVIDLASTLQPDVVVLDNEMPPGATGLESVDRIRAAAPGAAIVLYTASGPDVSRAAAAVGVDVLVAKGGKIDELVDAVILAAGVRAAEPD